MTAIRFAGITDTGRKRSQNQDNWLADVERGLFVVADGMGGHQGGETASRIVVETLPLLLDRNPIKDRLLQPEAAESLERTISELSRLIRDESRTRPGLMGMGTTLVMAILDEGIALIAHLGDSRAYLFRESRLNRLTKDHSILQILLDTGAIKPEEAAHHPSKGQITKAVGLSGEMRADTTLVALSAGDRLLLCSDGLTEMLSDTEIQVVLNEETDIFLACQRLVASANEAGGHDNVTVVLIEPEHAEESEDVETTHVG